MDETVDETRRALRLAAILTLTLSAAGFAGIWMVGRFEMWRRSMFFEQFATEGAGIIILALGGIAMLVLATGASRERDDDLSPRWLRDDRSTRIAIAGAAFALSWIGARLIFHDYALADDEYSGLFQATIYANGHATALVPPTWCGWIAALTPTSIAASGCEWRLSYFPINALIRAAFIAAHASSLMHPLIVAASVVLVMDTCKRAWPAEPDRAVVAGLFLAASTQFLVMSMSAFSMPAHLLASAAWLWLYVRAERWALIALPWLGVIALGIHSPFPHVLFVAPLVLRHLVERRYAAFAYVAVVYAVGCIAWVMWLNAINGPAASSAATSAQAIAVTAQGTLSRPAGEPILAALSTVALATWNMPIALACALVALLLWKRLDRTTRWIASSFIFTVLARAVFFNTYGTGWGNRYAHAVLPNLAILAAAGVGILAQSLGRRRVYRLVAAAVVVAVGIQLPLRGVQATKFVRPYERASTYLASLPADVVIVQFQSLQWGRQLLRNDPFLRNSPKLMDLSNLTPPARDSLERAFPGRVRYVRPEEITAFGVRAATRIGRFEIR